LNSRFGFGIERDHLGPFKSRHIERQFLMRRGSLWLFTQKFLQVLPKVTQCKGRGRVSREICGYDAHESSFAKDRAQPGVIVVNAIKNPKPIDPVVNLEPLEGGEPIVRLDELGGNASHSATVRPATLHPVAGSKRAKNRGSHECLQFLQLRSARHRIAVLSVAALYERRVRCLSSLSSVVIDRRYSRPPLRLRRFQIAFQQTGSLSAPRDGLRRNSESDRPIPAGSRFGQLVGWRGRRASRPGRAPDDRECRECISQTSNGPRYESARRDRAARCSDIRKDRNCDSSRKHKCCSRRAGFRNLPARPPRKEIPIPSFRRHETRHSCSHFR